MSASRRAGPAHPERRPGQPTSRMAAYTCVNAAVTCQLPLPQPLRLAPHSLPLEMVLPLLPFCQHCRRFCCRCRRRFRQLSSDERKCKFRLNSDQLGWARMRVRIGPARHGCGLGSAWGN